MQGHRKKILIADCHEDVLILLEKLLEDAGFDTTTVWTAKDAIRLADSHSFDLVLVNERLPDADCEDVLKALRKRGDRTPSIVMQPGTPETIASTRLKALGAKNIVCKHCCRRILDLVRECLLCGEKRLAA
jgi:DNA-binding response OmpR family regulator